MRSLTCLLAPAIILSGCVSAGKQPVQPDRILSEISELSISKGQSALGPFCASGVSGACALQGKPVEEKRAFSIMQGVTSLLQSRFVVLVPKSEVLVYFVRYPDGRLIRLQPERYSRADSSLATDQLEVFALQGRRDHELIVLGSGGELRDRRVFRALDTGKSRARVAVISCMDDHLLEIAGEMWPQVLTQAADLILLIGDNVYADHVKDKWTVPGPETIWNRYVETRRDLPLFKAATLVPVVAVWDDHDYGRNDSDRTFVHKDQSLDVFLSFFPQRKPAPAFERGPGVASWIRAFGVQIALLDNRFFRSPDKQDLVDQTHFGADQENWLSARLKAAETPVLLVSGDQFFGGYHTFESYEGSHPKSFEEQLTSWRQSPVPLLFISGDRHLSEIIKVNPEALGYPTFEITSSGIHAKVFPDALKDHPSPNQLVGVAGQYNFSILELMRADRRLLQLSVQSFGMQGKQLYQKTLTVKHP